MQSSPPPAPPEEENDEARPPWHWIGFGTVAIFAAWLPLAYLAGAYVKRRLAPYVGDAQTLQEANQKLKALPDDEYVRVTMIQLVPHLLALGLGAAAGGFLVGRFGSGVREASMAGAMATLIAVVLAGAQSGFSWTSIVMVGLGAGFAWLGGKGGVRSKKA